MTSGEAATNLRLPLGDRVVLLVGGPVLGFLLGLALFPVTDWAGDHVPVFRALTKFLTSADSRWDTVGFAVAGAVLGIAWAISAIRESLTMKLTNHELQLRKKDVTTNIFRGDVSAAFTDGKQLVVVGQRSEELFRDRHDFKSKEVAAAFRERGWPWADSDPLSRRDGRSA